MAPYEALYARRCRTPLCWFKTRETFDAILPRKGPVTRAMSKRLQKDWARATEEGPRVLMNLRVDF